ncbi:hypothetical protein [Aminicella lysinilytica]|uniref:hypothetical protein n=1 Tax=Aminicella lysinilytica TaxID=433323 RepID=UPI0026EF49D4|nr:hypothetical protein [Aminicella lysinilytica]
MYSFIEQAGRELKQINFLIEKIANKSTIELDGWLYVKSGKDGNNYYLQKRSKNNCAVKQSVFIGTDASEEVRKIKESRFYAETLKRLEEDKRILEALMPQFLDYGPSAVTEAMPKVYSRLPAECYDDERYKELVEWAKGEFDTKPKEFPPGANITITNQKVRSKGELAIFNLLVIYGIPFRYEQKLVLIDTDGTRVVRYPDFTIQLADGTIIYWEHAGSMEKPAYFDAFCDKLRIYYHNGITLGDNFIVTANREADGQGMNTENIEALICEYILPRVKTMQKDDATKSVL